MISHIGIRLTRQLTECELKDIVSEKAGVENRIDESAFAHRQAVIEHGEPRYGNIRLAVSDNDVLHILSVHLFTFFVPFGFSFRPRHR